jgi:hypothetical protein
MRRLPQAERQLRRTSMKKLLVLAVTIAIATVVFGSAFIPRSVDNAGSITKAMTTSKTLSPHEIHLNYKNMKELPVREVKEPF